jgi:iron complex outermembrane receptor protein
MKDIIDLLHTGGYSCVIRYDMEVRTFTQRGVADLYDLLQNESDFLKGASVADKVIGKAAAALMIIGGVKEVYTDLISLPALLLFGNTDIKLNYKNSTPFIRNRDNTGWCPLETLCYQEELPENILPLIKGFIDRMRNFQIATHI